MIGGLAGAGGIEAQRNPVVAERGVALGDVGADLRRLVVEAVEREVDVAIVVGDADVGLVDVRHVVAAVRVVRDPLPGRHRRLRPHLIVEDAVQLGRLGGARHPVLGRRLRERARAQAETQRRGDESFHGPHALDGCEARTVAALACGPQVPPRRATDITDSTNAGTFSIRTGAATRAGARPAGRTAAQRMHRHRNMAA